MNLRQTAEVAALVATSASHIVESPHVVPTASLHGYWKQSRTRLRCWFAGLRTLQAEGASGRGISTQSQDQLIALCREILVTEMLTRVWSSVLIARDRRWSSEDTRSAVDSVFRGHQEARHEVLSLLANAGPLALADQISLDRFRRRMERWTDALLGPLVAQYGVVEFAFDEQRARDYSSESLQGALQNNARGVMPLLLAGLNTALPAGGDADRERSLLNLAIVRTILSAYPSESFGSDGQMRSQFRGQIARSGSHPESPPSPTRALSFIELRRRERRQERSGD